MFPLVDKLLEEPQASQMHPRGEQKYEKFYNAINCCVYNIVTALERIGNGQ